MAGSKEELKSLLTVTEESEKKLASKLSIQKTKIMASSPITSWQIEEKQWKQWQTIFLGSTLVLVTQITYEIIYFPVFKLCKCILL